MLSSRYYSASRVGTNPKPRSALIVDDDEDLYTGFNEVSPALDTRALREDQAFQEALKTASIGRKLPSRMGTGMFRQGTVNVRAASSRPGTAAAGRPMTAVRAAGYTSTARSTPTYDEKKEESIEDKIKHMESRIMSLVEESCMLSVRPSPDDDNPNKREYDLGKALGKAQEASALERQLIRMQEQANLGDSHNLDLTFAVLCNLAEHYALNEMYTEALNTYQLLTRNKLFPHANRLKVNMGNIYFKMGEHPKALKLYRMALDQTPTAEKDLRMKVMHNIGLLLVRMGKFRDAVTNFQHIMHEQGDFQTGLHLVLCSVALNDAEGCKAAFHAMLDVEPPTYHQDITVDDEKDAYEAVMRDVIRADRLSRWSRHAAAGAERCLALAAAAAASMHAGNAAHADNDTGMSWCVEALRGYDAGGGGGAGARLELSAALASLRTGGVKVENGLKALQRLKAVARAHNNDRIVKSEANADAAFVAYALSNWSEANTLATAAAAADAYSCVARVTSALATAKVNELGLASVTSQLAAAARLDVACLTAAHDLALSLEASEDPEDCSRAEGRWSVVRGASGAACLRAFAAAGLARAHANKGDYTAAEHWYSTIGTWDVSVASALAQIHSELGDTQTAKHHYQDVEAVWPCDIAALEWLGAEARTTEPEVALQYYQRAARLQPNNPQWGLLIGACLRASGKYQEALAVYKKMNIRFPDNVPCLKLIVKLCGDQGLAETAQWNRELQRAQARLKQQERASVPSAASSSSGHSQSPIDNAKGGRADSATMLASSRSQLSTASSSGPRAPSGKIEHGSGYGDHEPRAINRSLRSAPRKKKVDEFDDELPLPPE